MSGYNPGATVYKLVFVDREGLIVKMLSLPTGEFLMVAKMADLAESLDEAEALVELRGLLGVFAKYLVCWNVELPVDPADPESPVEALPTTVEGVLRLELDLVLEMILAWVDAVAGTSGPLGRPSTSGDLALEASIPMDPL